MEINIKTRIVVLFIVIILILTFSAGWFLCDLRTSKRDSGYTERISDLTGELKSERDRSTAITDGLRWATTALDDTEDRVTALEERNSRLESENRRIVEQLGDIGSGIGEDSERLGEIIRRLDVYIEETKTSVRE
jgi:chromosome segregation ATPase